MSTLFLISVGPGFSDLVVPKAQQALTQCDTVIGYDLYFEWIQEWIAEAQCIKLPLTQERKRAQIAIDMALSGKTVGLISSGDVGVYAMAAVVFELFDASSNLQIEVIPGVSAANACASILGSPLSHDFATLSLSDLLCEWEWIEKRATHLAQADLVTIFYNVQSAKRQTGVYTILEIMQQYKSKETLCGIVRNAYRPDQSSEIVTLAELSNRSFDMLTSLIIGNQFTEQKGKYLYTPRGYQGWKTKTSTNQQEDIPQHAIWIFSGTKDGNTIAQHLAQKNDKVVVSTATEYGKKALHYDYPHLYSVSGSLGKEYRTDLLKEAQARLIIDATHPFATNISSQLIQISQETHIPYLRFERPRIELSSTDNVIYSRDVKSAVAQAQTLGKRIFLSTGIQSLHQFVEEPCASRLSWFIRMTPSPKFIQNALDLGIAAQQICAMQGPFTQSMNEALWKQWNIDCVISKDSGHSGGFLEKHRAATALNIPMIVLERPKVSYPQQVSSLAEVYSEVERLVSWEESS